MTTISIRLEDRSRIIVEPHGFNTNKMAQENNNCTLLVGTLEEREVTFLRTDYYQGNKPVIQVDHSPHIIASFITEQNPSISGADLYALGFDAYCGRIIPTTKSEGNLPEPSVSLDLYKGHKQGAAVQSVSRQTGTNQYETRQVPTLHVATADKSYTLREIKRNESGKYIAVFEIHHWSPELGSTSQM